MQATFHNLLFFPPSLNPPIKTPHRHQCIKQTHSISSTALHDYQLLFTSQPAELVDPLPLLVVEGSLPPDFPLGTYYLNGPGMISDAHGHTVNPLDGHGYLRTFRFIAGGTVVYSARYVETEAAREERDEETGAWRFRRPGIFSMFRSHWTSPFGNMLKNVANTTVLSWGGRLFCLWEGGSPYELDPVSLGTIGVVDFMGMGMGEIRDDDDGGGGRSFVAKIVKGFFHC